MIAFQVGKMSANGEELHGALRVSGGCVIRKQVKFSIDKHTVLCAGNLIIIGNLDSELSVITQE